MEAFLLPGADDDVIILNRDLRHRAAPDTSLKRERGVLIGSSW